MIHYIDKHCKSIIHKWKDTVKVLRLLIAFLHCTGKFFLLLRENNLFLWYALSSIVST